MTLPSERQSYHMDLADLKTRVDRARAAMEAPMETGEARPIMPVTAFLAEDDWKEAWKVVRLIREHHVDVFNRFPEAPLCQRQVRRP